MNGPQGTACSRFQAASATEPAPSGADACKQARTFSRYFDFLYIFSKRVFKISATPAAMRLLPIARALVALLNNRVRTTKAENKARQQAADTSLFSRRRIGSRAWCGHLLDLSEQSCA